LGSRLGFLAGLLLRLPLLGFPAGPLPCFPPGGLLARVDPQVLVLCS